MTLKTLILRSTVAVSAGISAVSLWAAPTSNWPGFRGPSANGVAEAPALPLSWSKTENVKWVIDVPGRGWSSPVIWNNVVYLTSAISSKPFKQPSPGLYGNDYIAELRAQGLSNEEVSRRVRARD